MFYKKSWDTLKKSRSWITHLIAAFFSVCMLIGLSYSTQGSWAFIIGSKYQVIIAIFAFIGYFALFDVALSLLYCWLEKRKICRTEKEASFSKFIDKHYFLFCFLIIYLCWLPFIIAFFPGSVPADGYRQLDMFVGGETFTTRHAWVLTMFVGALMQLGRTISDNAGAGANGCTQRLSRTVIVDDVPALTIIPLHLLRRGAPGEIGKTALPSEQTSESIDLLPGGERFFVFDDV